MPAIITRGAMSAQGFGFGASAAPQNCWIGTLGTSGQSDGGYSSTFDSSGNFYFGGVSAGFPAIDKYNSSGVIQWQNKINSANYSTSIAYGMFTDSSGNIYVAGGQDGNGGAYISKFNSTGAFVWQEDFIDATAGSFAYSTCVYVDSSSNVYVGGTATDNASYTVGIICKLNSSGTVLWTQRIGNSTNNFNVDAINADTSGNVYVSGRYTSGANVYAGILKFNSSGTLQWQKYVTSGLSDFYGVSTDSSGNVYLSGGSANIMQLNSSGVIQWQRSLLGANYAYSIAIDSLSNVYIAGGYPGNLAFSAKYNSSGSIQWQRKIGATSSGAFSTGLQAISVDGKGNYYICGSSSAADASGDFFFAKLPSDGSKTGAYTVNGFSYTYAAGSYTDSATSLTLSNSSLATSANYYSASTTSYTTSATTLTSSVTTI